MKALSTKGEKEYSEVCALAKEKFGKNIEVIVLTDGHIYVSDTLQKNYPYIRDAIHAENADC